MELNDIEGCESKPAYLRNECNQMEPNLDLLHKCNKIAQRTYFNIARQK